MTSIAVRDNLIAIARGLHIDCYDYSTHNVIEVETKDVNDSITDIIIASNCEYIAVITSTSKQLIVYDLPLLKRNKSYVLPRSASKIRCSMKNHQIFVADKSGDVLMYDLTIENNGSKILGHLSLLLNVLQTNDCKFIVSSDRDEKIRVSCYPNTYNIQTYCLGHREFVNHLELLPHNEKYLTSTSGDGTIKCWDYTTGKQYHNIDTFLDINDRALKENFTKVMTKEGIEVNSLPIVHYSITKIDDACSILAVTIYSLDKILIYSLRTDSGNFEHKLLQKLDIEEFPASLQFHALSLFVFYDVKGTVDIYKYKYEKPNIELEHTNNIQMFINNKWNVSMSLENKHSIKLLYKRKFDNVQEYQERKKQRLRKA